MRVGYLTYGLDRSPTGIGRYALELLRDLAKIPDGPEMVLLTTEREDLPGIWDQFEHYPLPGCRLLPALMTVGNFLLSQAERRYGLDIIHDPNGIVPFLGPRYRAKRIVTIHDAFSYRYPETHNRLDNFRYQWMLPKAAQQTDAVITVSECSREDLSFYLNIPADHITVIPEGVSSCFKPIEDDTRSRNILAWYGIQMPYILYLGGINARKNIARLFEAFAQVRKCHSDVSLVIGGKRQWRTDEIDATYRKLNLKECVRFIGYVAEKDLPVLYSAAELFVFPSLYEGFGLPPLEAMACGTPVVTSEASSLSEVTGDAAIQVNPYDVNALANAMQHVLADPALQADLRLRGIKRANLYTWQRTAQETYLLYQMVQGSGEQRAVHITRSKE